METGTLKSPSEKPASWVYYPLFFLRKSAGIRVKTIWELAPWGQLHLVFSKLWRSSGLELWLWLRALQNEAIQPYACRNTSVLPFTYAPFLGPKRLLILQNRRLLLGGSPY